jgi:histidinol-phosphatase (PHP family)
MRPVLPADGHVHTQWSWDAVDGSMERTCARAVELGLPGVAFTEHADHTAWTVLADDLAQNPHLAGFVTDRDAAGGAVGGTLSPPRLDSDGYLASVARCRDRFPDLRIITGVELGEPHWHRDAVALLLEAGRFDRVLGSLHCLPDGDKFSEPPNLFRQRPAADVVRDYLAELPRLIEGCEAFAVLAHIDYPTRYWPADAGPFDVHAFEDEFRHALRVLADSGRALEVNTRGALRPDLVRWWREEGGQAVTFGSDAHDPTGLARGFTGATAMVEAAGFRAGLHPDDFWTVSSSRALRTP